VAEDTFTGAAETLLATHDANWGNVDAARVVSLLELNGSGAVRVTAAYTEAGECGARYTTSTALVSEVRTIGGAATSTSRVILYVRADGTDSGYQIQVENNGTNWNQLVVYKDGVYVAPVDSSLVGTYAIANDHTFVWSAQASGANRALLLTIDGTTEWSTTDSSSPIARVGNPGFGMTGIATTPAYITYWTDQVSGSTIVNRESTRRGVGRGVLRGV
jgi:hypothetical protein